MDLQVCDSHIDNICSDLYIGIYVWFILLCLHTCGWTWGNLILLLVIHNQHKKYEIQAQNFRSRKAFLFTINAKAPLHVGFQPCFDTPQKCGFINASVSMNMLSGTLGQGKNPFQVRIFPLENNSFPQ